MAGTPNAKISPKSLIRIGLGAVFLYAGISALINPMAWVGFVPSWVSVITTPFVFLAGHAVFQILIAIVLFSGVKLRVAASIAFIDILGILVFFGVDDVTFRDFGLLTAAAALFFLSRPQVEQN